MDKERPVLLIHNRWANKFIFEMAFPNHCIEVTDYYNLVSFESIFSEIEKFKPEVFFCDFGPVEDPYTENSVRVVREKFPDLPISLYTVCKDSEPIAEEHKCSYFCTWYAYDEETVQSKASEAKNLVKKTAVAH